MRTILIATACLLLAGEAAAQAQAQVTTTGSATIMDPAQIAPGAALKVEPVARPKSGSATANATAGSFTLVGQGGEAFDLAVPSSVKLVRSGGVEEIELTLKSSGSTGTFAGAQGTVSATQVGIGGTAPVTSSSPAGLYEGQVPVTLTYQ